MFSHEKYCKQQFYMYTNISILHDRGEKYLQILNYKSYEVYLYRFMDLLEHVQVYF